MTQLDTLERGPVVGDRQMVLGGAINEVEHTLRQASRSEVPDVQAATAGNPGYSDISPKPVLGRECPVEREIFVE